MKATAADDEFVSERQRYHRALDAEFARHPEMHGKLWAPMNVPDNPFKGYIPMSFSRTLLDIAGGAREIRKWFQVEPW